MIRRKKIKDSDDVRVTFVQPLNDNGGRVFVAGDFNNWEVGSHPLVKRSNGTASVAVTLGSGERHSFRYVTEDGVWFNDAEADGYEPNGIDGFNCVVQT
jgi:hypothetical protein